MKYLIANWKTNFDLSSATSWLDSFVRLYQPSQDIKIILAPSAPLLFPLEQAAKKLQIALAAQNIAPLTTHGTTTGEYSAEQVNQIAGYVILGHPERRALFNETDESVQSKIQNAQKHHLTPIICLTELDPVNLETQSKTLITPNTIIAYEPQSPVTDIAQLKQNLAIIKTYTTNAQIPLIYGGGVTKDNIDQYLSLDNLDGFLIGRSSLDVETFCAILEKMKGDHHE